MKRYTISSVIILFLFFFAACGKQNTPVVSPTLVPTIQLLNNTSPRIPVHSVPSATPDVSAPVWVSNPVDKVVLRIDPNSNTITAAVRIDGSPDIVAAGEGAVWALDRQQNRVFRIDPVANRAAVSVRLPDGVAQTLIVGDGAVWIGMTGRLNLTSQEPGQEGEVTPPGMVVQIDPKDNHIIGQFSVQPVSRLAINGTALWVLSRTLIDTPLQVIDLGSNQGMAVPLYNAPEWLPAEAMAIDANSLWLFSTTHGKIFHASPDGHITSTINLDLQQPTGYADLLLAGSGLWAITPWGSVLRIDPVTNHILAKMDLNVPLTRLLDTGSSIWVLSQQKAALYRIDPQRNEIIAQIKTGSPVQPTVVPSPTPRVVIWKPCSDAPTSRLKIGDLAYVTKESGLPNRVRKEPKVDSDILGYITPGQSAQLIEGPSCSNGWVWWKVKNADITGWTAEGDKESYWLIPLFP